MIVKPITFPNHQPLNRTLAAQVVQTASRFDARVMIRRHQKVVNTVLHFCDTFSKGHTCISRHTAKGKVASAQVVLEGCI